MSNSSGIAPQTVPVSLTYTIARCSEHSGRYVASNIMVDRPTDQMSRWSSISCAGQSDVPQWILLRLNALSIVKSITFGKFHKAHPCNMKDFELHVGMTEDHLTKVLESSLKNDTIPETFPIEHANADGVCFPVRFVKIVPLSAHGSNFHTSIWYVSLTGIVTEATVEQVRIKYDEYRETTVLRHILKHLRQRRLLTPFQHILESSGLQIEHPLITELYDSLVLEGNWDKTEKLLINLSKANLFESYVQSCQPYALWTRLHGLDADGDKPSARGGHGMCMDSENGIIYLLGGWDGEKSLDDFWAYHVDEDRWCLLSASTSSDKNGPGPRSCHKMVFDPKTGCIYLLGRLNDSEAPIQAVDDSSSPTSSSCSEFYRYHTRGLDAGKWDLLAFDTTSAGGPPLVSDHQMVIDSDAQIIYVFGGRIIHSQAENTKYSGFFSYNIRLSKWRNLLPKPDHADTNVLMIPPRYGHSMLLDTVTHTLLIIGGQREDKYLSDMYAYDINKGTTTELFSNFTATGGPEPFFTQRAVIDPDLRELYVLTASHRFGGLRRLQGPGSHTMLVEASANWFYRIDHPRPGKWSKILRDPAAPISHTNQIHIGSVESKVTADMPSARYAHQIVYDSKTRTVYMHGGNSGLSASSMASLERLSGDDGDGEESGGRSNRGPDTGTPDRKDEGKECRLDDFWKMTLKRPEPSEIVRRATYIIRRQQFREMCEKEPSVKALHFLQNNISSVVNHRDPEEAEIFRSLLTHLLAPSIPSPPPVSSSPKTMAPVTSDVDVFLPRKRSRSNTPEGTWTNRLDEDDLDSPKAEEPFLDMGHTVTAQSLQATEDPLEKKLGSGDNALSGSTFRQRTEVFEALLAFVDARAKQPDGSLTDMVSGYDKSL